MIHPEHLTSELDYELEIAVVIGKPVKFFGVDDAPDHIAGYVVFNDIRNDKGIGTCRWLPRTIPARPLTEQSVSLDYSFITALLPRSGQASAWVGGSGSLRPTADAVAT